MKQQQTTTSINNDGGSAVPKTNLGNKEGNSSSSSSTTSSVNNSQSKLDEKTPAIVKSPLRELRPFNIEMDQLNHETDEAAKHWPQSSTTTTNVVAGEWRKTAPNGAKTAGHSISVGNQPTVLAEGPSSGKLGAKSATLDATNHKSTYSTPSHWYQGFLNRTSRVIPGRNMFRSTSQSDLKKSEPVDSSGARSPSCHDCANLSVIARSANVNAVLSNPPSARSVEGETESSVAASSPLQRQFNESTSSIDRLLLAEQADTQRRTKEKPPPSTTALHIYGAEAAAVSLSSSFSRSSDSNKFASSAAVLQSSEHNRASLRRGKAVDLPSYASTSLSGGADHHSSTHVVGVSFALPQSSSSASATAVANRVGEVLKSSSSSAASSSKKDKSKTLRSKSSNESILKKLIGSSGVGSSKSGSTDDSPTSMAAALAQAAGARDSIKPDFSSDSLDFKSEEKLRKRIFVHYDCASIAASPAPLLNGTSRLEEFNLNAATGASQASRPKTSSSSPSAVVAAAQAPWLVNDDGKADDGDAKSNDVVLSCPYFRNELGGEPLKAVSLSRSAGEQTSLVADEARETWLRPSTAAEASVLENLSNVYLGGRLCASRQDHLVIEYVDHGAFYYRHCFAGKAHQNYFGTDDSLGPVAISVVRDKVENADYKKCGLTSPYLYRIIVRLSDMNTFRGAIMEDSLPSYQSAREQQSSQQTPTTPSSAGNSGGKIPVKELLELVIPELQLSCIRLAVPVPRTEEMLLKLDEQMIYTRYKVGILYCRSEQCTEEQMYNNEVAGPAFEEFLDMLGQRVRLKGFEKYKGGLDCKGDTTGQFSLYTSYQQYEVMFHVSTMLPFTSNNRQQLSRKRHIGNDIVTVIFQDPGALPFSAQTVRSHFQHVFVVVKAHSPNTDNVRYSVAVSRCKDVPPFGPPIPKSAVFSKSKEFRDFLLTKIINAENAVHKSDKFATMAARTRKEFMRDLAENHVTSHSLEGASVKIGKILGSKRRDRMKSKLILDASVHGAVVWDVQVLVIVEDFSLCKSVECFMAISADYLVLVEQAKNQDVLFCTPSHSIIGWTSHGNSLKLYYDHAEVVILRTLDDDDAADMQEIIKRLQAVTKGCETVEMILRRNAAGQLGFHIQHEGIVIDVEMYGSAWQAGLRQGSRLVEICKVNVATLTFDRMLELLRTSSNIRVLVIPPLEDGSPRRGCEDPACPSVMSDDSSLANFVNNTKKNSTKRQPPSYETTVSRKQLVTPTTVLTLEPESPVDRNGFDPAASGSVFSKSLDELQGRRRHSEELRSSSADHDFYNVRKFTAGGYPAGIMSSISSDEQRYRTSGVVMAGENFSSSCSSEASDSTTTSGYAHKPSLQPLELKRAVDKTKSDSSWRTPDDTDPFNINNSAMPLKSCKQKLLPAHQISMSSGQLTVPAHYSPHKTTPTTSSSLHENLLRLSVDEQSSLQRNLDEMILRKYENLQLPNVEQRFGLSPETQRGIEWSALVDAAAKAIEGMTQKAASSNSSSPEMSTFHLKYQAAQQRIRLLEEKADRLQKELENEREAKRDLEVEILSLSNTNKLLEEECRNAQNELKKFTEWFFRAVENTGNMFDPAAGESNNNRKGPSPKN